MGQVADFLSTRSPQLATALKAEIALQRAALIKCRDSLQNALDDDKAVYIGYPVCVM